MKCWKRVATTTNWLESNGKSGINMMSIFSTTGEAPIDEREILQAFNQMDQNKDDVLSRDEFSSAPEVSKLPQESQEELFDTIDLNDDGVIQYEEFKLQAQITESEVLAINREQIYMEAYKVAMEDFIITDDERKMLKIQAKALGISDQRVQELEQDYNSGIEQQKRNKTSFSNTHLIVIYLRIQ